MSRPPTTPVFLQRANYRQRRLRDAAKLVPLIGIILWALPLAWPAETGDTPVGSARLLYVFGVWMILIVLTAMLASRIHSDAPDTLEDAAQR